MRREGNQFFLVSIDDKIKTHSSDMVFNSRLDHDARYNSKSVRWYFGKDFVLFNKVPSFLLFGLRLGELQLVTVPGLP